MEKYRKVCKISEGAFGAVYQYQNLQPSPTIPETVAIKEVYNSGNVSREISILKELPQNPNTLTVYEVIEGQHSSAIVMQKGLCDLSSYMQKRQYPIQQQVVKRAAKDLLEALSVLHCRKYIHRDLKPSNIILKANGKLTFCDYGSAVKCSQGEQYPLEGFTRWYKSPEMLLGSRTYGFEVDIWSLGCILMELATGEPYFDGKSEIELLSLIAQELGSPDESTWPSIGKLPDHGKISFKPMKPKSIGETAQERAISPELSRFLKKMVKYDSRATAEELLRDPFIADLKLQNFQDSDSDFHTLQREKLQVLKRVAHSKSN